MVTENSLENLSDFQLATLTEQFSDRIMSGDMEQHTAVITLAAAIDILVGMLDTEQLAEAVSGLSFERCMVLSVGLAVTEKCRASVGSDSSFLENDQEASEGTTP